MTADAPSNAPRRATKQQDAIRVAIAAANRPLSVQEIHDAALETVPGLGVSTVYRALRRLEDDGDITPVNIPGQPDRYELAEVADTHHHHFHCTRCDRVYDIDACPGDLQGMLPKGFTLEDHELTLKGTCARCARQ
ncbi:MAG: transcriptional repressor [Planctomycetota bacterium]